MDETQPSARAALEHAIRTLPIPASPPPTAREDAAIGLAFLEMALRQNHIRRISDRLVLTEHLRVDRSTQADVSLSLLDDDQRDACAAFRTRPKERRLRTSDDRPRGRDERPSKTPHESGTDAASPPSRDGESDDRQSLWVPIARLPRSSSTPVEVRDSAGARLPRLTQLELAMPTASGLYQLLRATLNSQTDAVRGTGHTEASKMLGLFFKRADPARWLVESSLQELFAGRSLPPAGRERDRDRQASGDAEDRRPRRIAQTVLDRYAEQLDPFFSLLEVALKDYLLVAALPRDQDHHIVTYTLPLATAGPDRQERLRAAFRALTRGPYLATYETAVPVGLRAYHLVVEADPSVNVDGVFLTSDADTEQVRTMTADMRSLAAKIEHSEADEGNELRRITEHELQKTLGELAELQRRRSWEAQRSPGGAVPTPAIDKLAAAWRVTDHIRHDSDEGTPLIRHHDVSAQTICDAVDEIEKLELDHDYWRENEPPTATAHAYWRRRYGHQSPTAKSITLRAGIALSDASGSHSWTIMKYVVAVLAVGLVSAIVGAASLFPFGPEAEIVFGRYNRSAVVAVLLVVPSFLYTRLGLPRRGTVAARVQTLPKYAAYLTIFVAIVQALVVAAGASRWYEYSFGIGCGLLALVAAMLAIVGSARRIPGLSPGAPKWIAGPERRRNLPVDMSLKSSGAEHA